MSPIRVFTDGSCVGNGKKDAVGGYGVWFEGDVIRAIGKPILPETSGGVVTNNRAELLAILAAMYVLHHYDDVRQVQMYVDSQYAKLMLEKYCLVGRALPPSVKNDDILGMIGEFYKRHFLVADKSIVLFHVHSHTNRTDFMSRGNQRADELAEQGRNDALKIRALQVQARHAKAKR